MIKNLVLTLISFISINSQEVEPVTWSYKITKNTDDTFNLSFDAEILDGWKLYSQFSPIEGALPTSFKFLNNQDFESNEVFNEDSYIVGYDNVFKMDLYFYENKANFNQNIRLINEETNFVKVEIDYSSCDDELCIFRNETFNISLNGNQPEAESESVTLDDLKKYKELELNLDKSGITEIENIQNSNYFEIFILGLIAGS